MKLSEAWLTILKEVSRKGLRVNDSTGDYLELLMQQVDIMEFDEDGAAITTFVEADNICEMRKVFLGGGKSCFGHDYSLLIAQNNQLGRVEEQLRRKPISRKAVVALGMVPDVEWVPCINTMHFYIRDSQLHFHYFSRGQDLWLKFIPDILAMRELQKDLAERLELSGGPGSMRGVISSAHIYTKDLPKVQKLLQQVS